MRVTLLASADFAVPTLDDNLASMAFDNVMADIQSQARATGLGGIKRFKNTFNIFRGHADSSILNCQCNIIASTDFIKCVFIFVLVSIFATNDYFAPVKHCFSRVGYQIHYGL